MKKNLFITIFLLISLFIIVDVTAYKSSGHIGLLTVSESANGTIQKGGTADLYLAIKPGTGRIFIDSFPLSKLDTQITMRFANEMSCDFLNIDCSRYDFFYTIRASSAIVGGPSAGAAATVLTTAMLDDQQINENIIMTGTINSGYLIGPVAGISAKTLAAQNKGYTKVLIPKWDLLNETINENTTIVIVPVSELEDALLEFTGKNYSRPNDGVYISEDYNALMKDVTNELCAKYGGFDNGVLVMPNLSLIISDFDELGNGLDYNDSNVSVNDSSNFIINISSNASRPVDNFQRASLAIANGRYYSAASFCFGGNVRITRELMKDYSNKKLKNEYAKLLGDIGVFEEYLEKEAANLTTISELETYMIVKERLDDSRAILREQNPDNISYADLAYAIERFDTAKVWARFFTLPGKAFVLDENVLNIACNKKIEETEERINYLQSYYPRTVDRTDLSSAYDYQDSGEYALCIFTASRAKADVDVILGVLFVSVDTVDELLDEKLNAAEKAITHQKYNNVFPILGYSYYEYAVALKDTDAFSALLYAEYALELSNLDMYFPAKKSHVYHLSDIYNSPFAIFVVGFCVGVLFIMILALIVHFTGRINNNNNKTKLVVKKRSRK